MFKGIPTYDLADITDDERREYWVETFKSHLRAPHEFVQFHFFVEGVTRSHTHQMVRQRTATFAQESLRFAVKENLAQEVPLPPSIVEGDNAEAIWKDVVEHMQLGYEMLVNAGIPAEDARGLLPHAVTTRLHWRTNLNDLLHHAGNRLCTQAQFEWRYLDDLSHEGDPRVRHQQAGTRCLTRLMSGSVTELSPTAGSSRRSAVRVLRRLHRSATTPASASSEPSSIGPAPSAIVSTPSPRMASRALCGGRESRTQAMTEIALASLVSTPRNGSLTPMLPDDSLARSHPSTQFDRQEAHMRHKRNPIYCDGKMVLQTDTRLERPHLTIVVPRSRFKRMVLCWFGIHWHETLDSTIDKTVYPYDQMDRNCL